MSNVILEPRGWTKEFKGVGADRKLNHPADRNLTRGGLLISAAAIVDKFNGAAFESLPFDRHKRRLMTRHMSSCSRPSFP